MSANIPPDLYRQILDEIGDDSSPVGIDAKKTHVIIIHKLMALEQRLARLERHSGIDAD